MGKTKQLLGLISWLLRLLVAGFLTTVFLVILLFGDLIQVGIWMLGDPIFWNFYAMIQGVMFFANVIAYALVPNFGKGRD